MRLPGFLRSLRLPSIVAVGSIVVSFCSAARAEAPSPASDAPSSPVARGISLSVIPGAGYVHVPYVDITLAPTYRFGREFALGLNLSYGWGAEFVNCVVGDGASTGRADLGTCDGVSHRFLRISVEPRRVFALGNRRELWLGGEFGVADLIELPPGGTVSHNAAPLVGVGVGLDFFARSPVSLGIEGRAGAIAFGGSDSGYEAVPQGLAPFFHIGIVFVGHTTP